MGAVLYFAPFDLKRLTCTEDEAVLVSQIQFELKRRRSVKGANPRFSTSTSAQRDLCARGFLPFQSLSGNTACPFAPLRRRHGFSGQTIATRTGHSAAVGPKLVLPRKLSVKCDECSDPGFGHPRVRAAREWAH